jgi:hypothetical protein
MPPDNRTPLLIRVRRCLLGRPFLEGLPAIPPLPTPIIERRFVSGFCARACFRGRFSPRGHAATTIRLSIQRRRRWAGALSLIKYGIRYITWELGHARSSASTTDSPRSNGCFMPPLRRSIRVGTIRERRMLAPIRRSRLLGGISRSSACFVRFNDLSDPRVSTGV